MFQHGLPPVHPAFVKSSVRILKRPQIEQKPRFSPQWTLLPCSLLHPKLPDNILAPCKEHSPQVLQKAPTVNSLILHSPHIISPIPLWELPGAGGEGAEEGCEPPGARRSKYLMDSRWPFLWEHGLHIVIPDEWAHNFWEKIRVAGLQKRYLRNPVLPPFP